MQIELRGIKEAKFNSHETTCFSATVVLDGVAAGKVSNAGHGGCHAYTTRDLESRLDAHAKTLPPIKVPGSTDTYPASADSIIDGLLVDAYIVRTIKPKLATGVYFMRGEKLLYCKMPKGMTADRLKAVLGTAEGVARTLSQLNGDRLVTDLVELTALMKAE